MHRSRISFALASSIFLIAPNLLAQQRVCCSCKGNSGPFKVEAPAGFPAKDVCPNSCSTNGGGWTGAVKAGSCSANPTPPPPAPRPAESVDARVIKSIRWSIGHQGARVWKAGGDELLKGQELFNAVIAPMDPGTDRDHVAEVFHRDGDITAATIVAIGQCKAEFPIDFMVKSIDWGCHHEGNTYNVRVSVEQGRYDDTRSLFSNAETP